MNDTKNLMRVLGAICWGIFSVLILWSAGRAYKAIDELEEVYGKYGYSSHVPGYLYWEVLAFTVLAIALVVATVFLFMDQMEKAGTAMRVAGGAHLFVGFILIYAWSKNDIWEIGSFYVLMIFAGIILEAVSYIMLGSTLKGIGFNVFRSLICFGIAIGLVILMALMLSSKYEISAWALIKSLMNRSCWTMFIFGGGHLFCDLAMSDSLGGSSSYGGAYGGYGTYGSGNSRLGDYLSQESQRKWEGGLLNHGGWRCYRCKRVNAVYVGFCACGMTRQDSDKLYSEAQEYIIAAQKKQEDRNNRQDNLAIADALLKYKSLLDSGVITQEEFDKKKKEILNGGTPKAIEKPQKPETPEADSGEWECDQCHKLNPEEVKTCKYCGRIKYLNPKYSKDAPKKKTSSERPVADGKDADRIRLSDASFRDEDETVSMANPNVSHGAVNSGEEAKTAGGNEYAAGYEYGGQYAYYNYSQIGVEQNGYDFNQQPGAEQNGYYYNEQPGAEQNGYNYKEQPGAEQNGYYYNEQPGAQQNGYNYNEQPGVEQNGYYYNQQPAAQQIVYTGIMCPYCGAPVGADDSFCHICGQKVR